MILVYTITAFLLMSGCRAASSSAEASRRIEIEADTLASGLLDPSRVKTKWEGWGTSLAWWAQGLGGSGSEDLYADLIFSLQSRSLLGQSVPGLGLNIVRYNIGGGGQPGDVADTQEKRPEKMPWYKDIDGYWKNWNNRDADSLSFDWSRDAAQRSMLAAALKRGVTHIEFFSNAPMWWMMTSKSSAGGNLQGHNHRDFAHYLASVVLYAKNKWQVPVKTIEPFNEPSAGWWTYPKTQEGSNISLDAQQEILQYLREELDSRGLDTQITASDENSMKHALNTANALKRSKAKGNDSTVWDLVSKVNVHSYDGLGAWRDNSARVALRSAAGTKPIWASEFGDPDGDGADLAQTIMEDVTYLEASAWIYWQVIEHKSAWGLINAKFGASLTDPTRGSPTHIHPKYYAFAHFTRFIREGMQIVQQPDPMTIVAWDSANKTLQFVVLNRGDAKEYEWDLSRFTTTGDAPFAGVCTAFNGSRIWEPAKGRLDSGKLRMRVGHEEIASVSVSLAP